MDRTDPHRFVIPTLPEGKGRNLLFAVRAPNAYIQGRSQAGGAGLLGLRQEAPKIGGLQPLRDSSLRLVIRTVFGITRNRPPILSNQIPRLLRILFPHQNKHPAQPGKRVL